LPARLNVRCSEIGWEMQRGKMAEAAARFEWQIVSLPDPNEGGQLV